MGTREISDSPRALAVKDKVAASTQNQALSALLFLSRAVLAQDVPWLDDLVKDVDVVSIDFTACRS